MYFGYVYDVMDIWICSRYSMVNIRMEYTIWYVHQQLVQQLQHFNWHYTLTWQEEIFLFHGESFHLMQIYFQLHTKYKHQYQQSIHDQTPTTSFTKPTLQSTTIGHTTIAKLSHNNIHSFNRYNHTAYKSCTKENIESFTVIFQQAELLIHYVSFHTILNDTLLQNTMIAVFDAVKYVLYLLFNIIFITSDKPIITLIKIWYQLMKIHHVQQLWTNHNY